MNILHYFREKTLVMLIKNVQYDEVLNITLNMHLNNIICKDIVYPNV